MIHAGLFSYSSNGGIITSIYSQLKLKLYTNTNKIYEL